MLLNYLKKNSSLSWMGPIMEALSKSYQKYEKRSISRSDEKDDN